MEMTVIELIEMLSQYDYDTPVMITASEFGTLSIQEVYKEHGVIKIEV